MAGGMRYMVYHILIGCGYNFLARCMLIIVLHTGVPNYLIYGVLCHVSDDVGLQCIVPILVHYLLHHRGDIRGDVGVVCCFVHGGIGCNIFDDVVANKCEPESHPPLSAS